MWRWGGGLISCGFPEVTIILNNFYSVLIDRITGCRMPESGSALVYHLGTALLTLFEVSKCKALWNYRLMIRFSSENRWSILKRKSIPDFSRAVVNRDHGSKCTLKIGSRFENENRGSILIWKSLIDVEPKTGSRFTVPSVEHSQNRVFNRGLIWKW